MIQPNTQEYKELLMRFVTAFGESIPLMMIPSSETIEGLTANVNKCIIQRKNLLQDIYGFKTDGSRLY